MAFEVSGPRICDFPSLATLVVDYGCKYLFQLARSDTPAVLQTTLRTISTMFETMRPRLKLQQELFLAFTVDRLAPPPTPGKPQFGLGFKAVSSPHPGTPTLGTPKLGPVNSDLELDKTPSTPRPLVAPARGDTRELLLETLSLISRQPSFMVDLYSNYDCDMNCENMFERLIDFAAKVSELMVQASKGFLSSYCRACILCNLDPDKSTGLKTPNTSVWTLYWRLLTT